MEYFIMQMLRAVYKGKNERLKFLMAINKEEDFSCARMLHSWCLGWN